MLTLAMSVLALPFLGAPVNADTSNPACSQTGAKVDSFLQRASADEEWRNGNIIEGLVEGGVVLEKVELSRLAPGAHELVIDYAYKRDTIYAFDGLQDPSFAPGPGTMVDNGATAPSNNQNEVVHRATFTWTQPAGDGEQTITFAAHLASEATYGTGLGAGSITGSPFHLTIAGLDCVEDGTRTNQVKVDKPTPPQPEPATVTVEKLWQINGGAQIWNDYRPAGFDAQLTLTGPATEAATDQAWDVTRDGYIAGDRVTIDERAVAVPQQCTVDRRFLMWENGAWVNEPLPYAVTLNKGDNVYKVQNEVTCKTGLTVSKVDDATGKAIDTATFQLWNDVNGDTKLDQGDTKVGTTKSTSNGAVTWTDLAYGKYLVQETVAPDGYTLPDPSYQPATVDKNSLWPTLTFRDTKKPVPPTGSITVRKHAGTATGALIDTAKFQLWNDVNGNGTLDQQDTKVGIEKSTSGGTATWTGLAYGKYLVQETVAPAGYTLPSPAYQPAVVPSQVTLDFVDQPKVTPPPVTPQIDLQVRKHAGTTTGALIDTARFQLWNDVDHNAVLDKAVDTKAGTEQSTTGGTYTWADLAPGAYLVEETVAPDGYTLPDPAYQPVTLTATQDGTTVTVDFVDQPKSVPVSTVDLQVRKHAGSVTGTLIDTATFQLWNDVDGNGLLDPSVDTKVGSAVDTSGGTYTWTGLATGTYLVREVTAPEGYSLPSPRYQAVTLAAADLGTTVTVDFADAQIAGVEEVTPPAEVAPGAGHVTTGPSYGGVRALPQTGARERNQLLGLLGTALVALGGGLLLSSRRTRVTR